MKALIVTHDGDVNVLDSEFNYEEIRDVVGGYIEAVYFGPDNDHFFAYINEEGKMLDLPENEIVTRFWYNSGARILIGDYIAGNAIFFGEVDDNGDQTDVPQDVIDCFMDIKAGKLG